MLPQNIVTPDANGTSYAIIFILLTVLVQVVMQILSTWQKKEEKGNSGLTAEQNEILKDLHKWHVAHKSSFGWEDRENLSKLFEWHNVKDEDGLPVWYVNRTLRRTVEETSETMSDIKDILRDLKDTVSNNTKVIEMFVTMVSKQSTSG